MGSEAATWAGDGAPPQLTSGDTATMAAPKAGFDPSLNPGSPEGVESSHTTKTAAKEAKLAKDAGKEAKKEEKKEEKAKTLAQKKGDPPAEPREPSPKEEAAAKAKEPVVKKAHPSEADAKTAAD